MNNREFLYSLEPHALTEWFDAEHTSNDTLGAKKVVSAASVDANDGNVSLKDSSDDTQSFTDSREKLEADVRKHIAISITPNKDDDGVLAPVQTVLEWLDRQAAITEREKAEKVYAQSRSTEYLHELKQELDDITNERNMLQRRNSELRTQYDKLKRERDYWREQLGIALDHAHDICTLVDLDGEVVS